MKKNKHGTILIIDDDKAMREFIAFLLEREGHFVTVCDDGNEGVRLFQQVAFDLVITDIMMPGMDGLAVMMEMQKIKKGVRILAMSGADTKDLLLDVADLFGALHTLNKPFAKEELLGAVANIMGSVKSTVSADL